MDFSKKVFGYTGTLSWVFFLMVLNLCSCEKQKRFTFDQQKFLVESCEGRSIHKIVVENQLNGKVHVLPIKKGGQRSVQIFTGQKEVGAEGLPRLESNNVYQVIVGGGHSRGYLEIYTNESAEIDSVLNWTPCVE